MILPDRAQVTMTVPFMRAYTERLVRVCHKHGAHAIGGMAAFIPNRRDPIVTENALRKVREDKLREFGDGCDGTWVAHPDLVPTVLEIANDYLGEKPNQKERTARRCTGERTARSPTSTCPAAQSPMAGCGSTSAWRCNT
jgi:malate synthase